MLALSRGETVNAVWFVIAAVACYAIAYRFYGAFLAATRASRSTPRAPTPAERINDGRDFVPTNRWVVFGHHFAAIAGPGPLIGPTLAAQFGYLPGTLWILVGVVLGGAVQDFCILCGSLRRDGRSLGQMAKDEIGPIGGFAALVGVFSIMVILIAVLGAGGGERAQPQPVGHVHRRRDDPDRDADGLVHEGGAPARRGAARPCSASCCSPLALVGGRWVDQHPTLGPMLHARRAPALAWSIIVYGFAASVLPVWLLLAPRDYLSTFVKLGTIGRARRRHRRDAARHPAAGAHALRRRHRPDLRRQGLPVRLHHHRLRRDLRLPLADLVGHDAEAAAARRPTRR